MHLMTFRKKKKTKIVENLANELKCLSFSQVNHFDFCLFLDNNMLCFHKQWRLIRMRMKAGLSTLCNVF